MCLPSPEETHTVRRPGQVSYPAHHIAIVVAVKRNLEVYRGRGEKARRRAASGVERPRLLARGRL
jgi:hypothetical protein